MWSCPKCNESLEDEFDSCWRCAGSSAPPQPDLATGSRTARLLLLPFKAYVVLAYPLLKLIGHLGLGGDDYRTMYSLFSVPIKYNTSAITGFISVGYAACVGALLLACFCRRTRAGALVFAGFGAFFLAMLYPWGTTMQ